MKKLGPNEPIDPRLALDVFIVFFLFWYVIRQYGVPFLAYVLHGRFSFE